MMNLFIEQLADDPKGTAIGVISAIAIIGGVGIGISRGGIQPRPATGSTRNQATKPRPTEAIDRPG